MAEVRFDGILFVSAARPAYVNGRQIHRAQPSVGGNRMVSLQFAYQPFPGEYDCFWVFRYDMCIGVGHYSVRLGSVRLGRGTRSLRLSIIIYTSSRVELNCILVNFDARVKHIPQ